MPRPTHPANLSEPERAQILEALNLVLASEKFVTAPQMSAFLRYVVEQSVNGNKKRIKAYTVAVDALGKPDTFDPQNDPVVRVLAGRLRASLTAYYEARPDAQVRILMKPGSYVPQFVEATADSGNVRQNEAPERHNLDKTPVPEPDAQPEIAGGYESELPNAAHPGSASANQSSLTTDSTSAVAPVTSAKRADSATSTFPSNGRKASLAYFASCLLRFPMVAVVSVFLVIGALFFIENSDLTQGDTEAGSVANSQIQSVSGQHTRERPEQVSLFVDATADSNTLTAQLNTMISGVFLESSAIRVYRLFDSSTDKRFWPEDYLISLEVFPLPDTVRVSTQLVEAQTGKITHSENLTLSKTVAESLTRQDYKTITQFARELVSSNGPLLQDYESKTSTSQAQ